MPVYDTPSGLPPAPESLFHREAIVLVQSNWPSPPPPEQSTEEITYYTEYGYGEWKWGGPYASI